MSIIRRNQKRLSSRLPIRFGQEKPDILGFVKNLSIGGVAIAARTIFPPGTQLKLLLEDNKGPINLTGGVRWVNRKQELVQTYGHPSISNLEMGVKFHAQSDEYVALLESLLKTFNEGRQETRFDKVLRVTYEDPEKLYEEYTANISMGGLYIITENPPDYDSIVEVHLILGDVLEVIHAEARVVHVITREMAERSHFSVGCGVQFLRFYENDKEKLRLYVESLRFEGK